ncbi:hypothetical protein ES708_01717 [subsurface metagenome]
MNTKKSTVIPVINIQGQGCTGCATSTLCSEYPSIKNIWKHLLFRDLLIHFIEILLATCYCAYKYK